MQFGMLLRALFSFVALLVLARILGKKQISHLTFFDYIVGISIGNIAASMSYDRKLDMFTAIQALVVWAGVPLLLDLFSRKSYWLRKIVDGMPTIVVQKGKVLQKNLTQSKMTVDDMMQLMREKDVFNLAQVEFAVLETNGKISVLKKTEDLPITPKTQGMLVVNEPEPRLVVVDGNLMEKTLSYLGYTKQWLLTELMKQGANSFQDVFLAQVDAKGSVYVDLFRDDIKLPQIKTRPLVAATLKKAQADLELFSLETDDPAAKEAYAADARQLDELIKKMQPYLKE